MSFTFDGKRKNYIKVRSDFQRVTFAPVSRSLIKIPSKAGSMLSKTETDVRVIKVPIDLAAMTKSEQLSFEEDFAEFLVHEEPKELIFDFEPERIYYAVVDGSFDVSDIATKSRGVISFIVPDSYKHARTTKSKQFSNGVVAVNNLGTAKALPNFSINVLDNITHLDIISQDAYMRIGEPADVDAVKYEPETLILNDGLTSLNGWTVANEVDNGYVGGVMSADSSGFYPSTFGSIIEPPKWQGPSVRRSIPEPLQDFRMEILVDLLNLSGKTGMIEIYLRDAASNIIAKIAINDTLTGADETYGTLQLGNIGNRDLQYRKYPKTNSTWNNFTGMLRITRKGNVFTPYFALVDQYGVHTWVAGAYSYTDSKNKYSNPITQIQVATKIYPGSNNATMKLKKLKIIRLNQKQEGTPYIAKAGDTIEINHADSTILLNGEERRDLRDFGAKFFEIGKGETALVAEPSEKLKATVSFRERYL